jgi:hypothetical protein
MSPNLEPPLQGNFLPGKRERGRANLKLPQEISYLEKERGRERDRLN